MTLEKYQAAIDILSRLKIELVMLDSPPSTLDRLKAAKRILKDLKGDKLHHRTSKERVQRYSSISASQLRSKIRVHRCRNIQLKQKIKRLQAKIRSSNPNEKADMSAESEDKSDHESEDDFDFEDLEAALSSSDEFSDISENTPPSRLKVETTDEPFYLSVANTHRSRISLGSISSKKDRKSFLEKSMEFDKSLLTKPETLSPKASSDSGMSEDDYPTESSADGDYSDDGFGDGDFPFDDPFASTGQEADYDPFAGYIDVTNASFD